MHRILAGRSILAVCLCLCAFGKVAFASAYSGSPKLVIIIVIDQFRGDFLDRGHDQFVSGGFRLLTDRGAWFTDCNYQYATPHTAPGHATLFTGAYSNGHGIQDNEYWNATRKKVVTSVEDDTTQIVGVNGSETGASPHNLLADTIGDELRLATDGKSRVFSISLKDRSSVLPAGFSGTAYWIDKVSGVWVTSTYYMKELPSWVQAYNKAGHADAYWNRDWKVGDKTLRSTTKPQLPNEKESWYDIVGATPFANEYQFDFARELMTQEKLGQGPTTDFLLISLSANDIMGHKAGPNSEESRAMVQALDHELADFFGYLGKEVGLGNIWIALSADHGISPAPSYVSDLKIPAAYLGEEQLRETLNNNLSAKYGKGEYVPKMSWPIIYLNPDPFVAAKISEAEAERMVADFFKTYGTRGYYTRVQLAAHDVPPTEMGRRYLNSLSPRAGWLVYMVSAPFYTGGSSGTDHAMPYSYDLHVPLAFYGLPFQPGVYRGHCEPVDMAATLSNLLGIDSPSAAIGRVLTEALVPRPTAPTEGLR